MQERGSRKYRHGKRGGEFHRHLKTMYDLQLSPSSIQHEIENALKLLNVGSGGD